MLLGLFSEQIVRSSSRWSLIGVACLLLMASSTSCLKSGVPTIEDVGAAAPPQRYSVESLTGKRDGARVRARFVLENGAAGNRLDLILALDLGPPIRLDDGKYSFRVNDKLLEGKVAALSVDFQAGQSSGMNLGGKFVLLGDNGTSLYRVTIPTTPFEAAYR